MESVLRTARAADAPALAVDSGSYLRRGSGRGVRKSRRKSQGWAVFLRLLTTSVLLVLAAWTAASVYRYLFYSERFDLQQVAFSGTRWTNVEALRNSLQQSFPRNLLSIDLARLRQVVESDSWVRRAQIRRVLPDTLKIDIQERQPVALAGIRDAIYVVDADGTLLDRYAPKYGKFDVPLVKGLDGEAGRPSSEGNKRRMALFLSAMRDLDSQGEQFSRTLSEVDVTDDQNLVVIPMDDTVRIQLGYQGFLGRYRIHLEKLTYFREMKERYGDIESIDLRYDKQIIYQPAGGSRSSAETVNPGALRQ